MNRLIIFFPISFLIFISCLLFYYLNNEKYNLYDMSENNNVIITIKENNTEINYNFETINTLNNNKLNFKHSKGIFIDFEYNPNYYRELLVVKYLLMDIINSTKLDYYYDYEHSNLSTMITMGFEMTYIIQKDKRNIITINPKLLKDILYNKNIFDRIYNFINNYFAINLISPDEKPIFNRLITFEYYTNLFKDLLKEMDDVNFNNLICKDYLINKKNKNVCFIIDNDYIDKIFEYEETREFYKLNLNKIATFSSILIESMTNLIFDNNIDCYNIILRPETNINRVLLFPHKAVITERNSENIKNLSEDKLKEKIILLIITIKHRILHSLGMIHKYYYNSVMGNYENKFQKFNLFYYSQEDYESLNKCYGDYSKPMKYVRDNDFFDEREFYDYIYNFNTFLSNYQY